MQRLLDNLNVEKLVTELVAFLPSLLMAFVILLAFWVGYRLARPALKAVLKKAHFHEMLITMIVDRIFKTTVKR